MQPRNLLIVLFFFFLNFINAQSDFRPGYVVSNNNDTLYGNIDYRGDMKMAQLCRFKENNSDSVFMYKPTDLSEYRFINSKCYVSRVLENGKSMFLEYLIKGELNVYYYRDANGESHYLMDKSDAPLKEVSYKEDLIKDENGVRKLYQSKYHLGLLSLYTDDAENFSSELNRVIKPEHQNLIKLAQKYHNAVCENGECVIYSKNEPLIDASIEPFFGLTIFNKKILNGKSMANLGACIYLKMLRANEHLSFKTGVRMLNFDDSVNRNYTVIPTQIHYEYSRYKLIPQLYLGLNNVFTADYYFWTVAAGCGVSYKISDRFYLTSNITSEFLPIGVSLLEGYSDIFLSYSVNVGLRINL